MKDKIYKAFTLVELIVVITILAILASLGFISFQGYWVDSRDTKRISDIATIAKWVQVYQARHAVVPEPSENRNIISSGSTQLIIQWYAGKSVLDTLKAKSAKDPLDNQFYTYSINSNKTKFQVMWLLEKDIVSSLNIVHQGFSNYSDRYIYTKWQVVWVVTQPDTKIPINELWIDIDLNTDNSNYEVTFAKDSSTISNSQELYDAIISANNQSFWTDSGNSYQDMWLCNQPDITVGTITIAACNLGTNIAATSKTDSNGYGHYYQFWRNISFENGGWDNGASANGYDWLAPGGTDQWSANNWWISNNENTTATYSNQSSWDQNLLKWPCPDWYHVPTNKEWNDLITVASISNEDDAFNILWLPLAGARSFLDSTMSQVGSAGAYWSSSPSNSDAYDLLIMWTNILPNNLYTRSSGYSIRCFKN